LEGRPVTLKNSRDVLSSGDVLEGSSLDHRKGGQDHRKGGRRRGRIVLPLLVVCAVVAAIMATDYRMTHGEIYRGVSVGGVPVGGKTPEEARGILQERTGGFEEIELTGPEKFTVSSEQLDVNFDVRSSANKAYTIGRQGNLFKRLSDRMEATWGTVSLPLAVDYERERLRDGLSGVVAALTVETVEAGFEINGNEVSVTPSRTERKVDEEKLLDDLEAGLAEGRREYEVPVATAEPELTTEEAERLKPTTLLGRYRTDYRETSDKSYDRVENLEIASNAISGSFLAPGEVFSLSELVAPLKYNMTKVIIEGKEEKADGGGLCQVSSTLYMAANYAGLEVVERHPHYAQLPYIRPGFDATVWFGYAGGQPLDMKFKNDTDGYVLIREWVADDGHIYAEIWGRPTGEEVEMYSRPEYVGPDYSKWVTYKKVKENGEVVFDDVFHKDVYKPLVDEKGKVIRPDSEEAKPAPVKP
jgi:vancomycin resistance protein YoaR